MADLAIKQYTNDSQTLTPISRRGESFINLQLHKQTTTIQGRSIARIIPNKNLSSVLALIKSLSLTVKIGE